MSLIEYLYQDKKRINSYLEQVSSPVTYDRVPVWKTIISLTPKAELAQNRISRPLTDPEKITKILEHLNKQESPAPFALIQMLAKKIIVPLRKESNSEGNLVFWINSKQDKRDKQYCLFEDSVNSKGASPSGSSQLFSSYSALVDLIREIELEWNQSILSDTVSVESFPQSSGSDLTRAFSDNPAQFFIDLGAKLNIEREIITLYRQRAILMNPSKDGNPIVFGYPIFIAASDGGTDTFLSLYPNLSEK